MKNQRSVQRRDRNDVDSSWRRPAIHYLPPAGLLLGCLLLGCLLVGLAASAQAQIAQVVPAFNKPISLMVGDEYNTPAGSAQCERKVYADVVAIDQVIVLNRLGAFLPPWMMYALKRDVEPISGSQLGPGNAQLRIDKRPRPLVLRMNVGDCLEVTFTNLLAPSRVDNNQPVTRAASIMVDGLSLVDSIDSSGSHVGLNSSSLALPGQTKKYLWYASKEGPFVFNSGGAMTGGEGDGGQVVWGLFGVINVEPRGSVWYRSQLTSRELDMVTGFSDALGNRQIKYNELYPLGHPFAGLPVVKILDTGNNIVHSDLNAIIDQIPPGTYPKVAAAAPDNNGVERSRDDPFREFTVVYHDEVGAVQAFPVLENEFFAHSIRDNMAINYGTGGIGAEIISYGADSIVQGAFGSPHIPAGNAKKCNDCKYEEAFLSAWAVGDPAMIVERGPTTVGQPWATGPALQALFPDDPSNVHHSYMNDHVKMRVVHGGVAEHHVHHLHAHQWLHTQNSDNSTYNDSQAIGPGSAFTLDIAYNGSGNRNKTVGDSIFHCHFYPHFAQGMWELWRVHDVFEDGNRTLPDAEIPGGSPIPAILPIPRQAMALPPTASMPGYPFYIPGIAGHRPPHPPLDTIDDGGLPRHVVRGGKVLDGHRGPFDREMLVTDAVEVPETGTPLEIAAMAFHAQRTHASKTPDLLPATFITNGAPPAAGAPFADPCVDDNGQPVGTPRTIKAAVLQIDAIINKAGWHFPQTRLEALWGDVTDYQNGTRAPEPFFIRAHSNDCIEFFHTNLVPNYYDVDDFQVFTPTDLIGQHIHLVKFDVTGSDGSGNGWNYEDGTFSPDEVIERINAINANGGLDDGTGNRYNLTAQPHPYFGVVGAQTTVQRWWADPLLNGKGEDRTLRTVFTHDHFGPSTHQQAGLYAGLLVEPEDTQWRDPETGVYMGNRFDGGPTSWRADIIDPALYGETHREFVLEFQDFALAYTADNRPVNPPGRVEVGLPFLVEPPPQPMPEGVSADDVGTYTVNYRNEPLALRLRDPSQSDGNGSNGIQATGNRGDISLAYSSTTNRADSAFNVQPSFYPPLTNDVQPRDPYTPLMRAYEGDKVAIRLLTGAHEEGHNFTVHGLRWLHEPDEPTSGFKNNQMNGISEHFEVEVGALQEVSGNATQADYLYQPGASVDDQWNGLWGLLREYEGVRSDLLALPGNEDGQLPDRQAAHFLTSKRVCPAGVPLKTYEVIAVRAADVLLTGALTYNDGHNLDDPLALLYVLTSDLGPNGKLLDSAPREPLILRAAAGDCIRVTLTNGFLAAPEDKDGYNMFPMIVNKFNANQMHPSSRVGLHAQLVDFDVRRDNGIHVGFNAGTTVQPGQTRTYEWYAGKVEVDEVGRVTATPIEFGATNLAPSDVLQHSHKGLVGALIIEPHGATWTYPDSSTRAVADIVFPPRTFGDRGYFREFVMVTQDDIQLRFPSGEPVPPIGGEPEDSEDSANKAINYRTEPMWTRAGFNPGEEFMSGTGTGANDFDIKGVLSIADGGPIETPIFSAAVGTPVRFRVLHPQGHPRNNVISIHGHQWRHEPSNPESDFIGSQAGHGPGGHWDIIPLHGAGGGMGIPGDYLYRTRSSMVFDGGIWGVFRVTQNNALPDDVVVP